MMLSNEERAPPSRFFRVTFLEGFIRDLFRGEKVTSIWGIKRSLGRIWWLFFLVLQVFVLGMKSKSCFYSHYFLSQHFFWIPKPSLGFRI